MEIDLSKLEKNLGVTFKKQKLLKEALTHRSYINENPSWGVPHNERLEYLGDAVLELLVTEYLYAEYPSESEGQLTTLRAALVNYQMLARVAKEFNLEEFILLSRGEAKDTGKAREVILANAFEALIGAVYLDGGYKSAAKVIQKFLLPHLKEVIKEGLYENVKGKLQEIAQEKLKITPTYKLIEEAGPDHQKIFKVGVYYGDKLIAEGEGTSKQEAETAAAREALKKETE